MLRRSKGVIVLRKIIDGNATDLSRWSASGYPQSLVIDYGELKSIIGTRVYTYQDRAYQFKVELDDNLDFTSPFVIDQTANVSVAQPIENNFSTVKARYARITVTGAAAYTGEWVSINEFEIVEGTSAIGDVPSLSQSFILQPNPANTQVNITIDARYKNASLCMYDARGRMVQERVLDASTNRIDLEKYASGVYIIKIAKDHEIVYRKLIIE